MDIQSLKDNLLFGEGYYETYGVSIEGGGYHTVTIIFDSEDHSEQSEVDLYDDCREKVSQWISKHFPGESIATDGDDIERSGYPADNDDVIDMRTTVLRQPVPFENKNENLRLETDNITKELASALDKLSEIQEYYIEGDYLSYLHLTVDLVNGNSYDFRWDDEYLCVEGDNDGKWDYMAHEFIEIGKRLDQKYRE